KRSYCPRRGFRSQIFQETENYLDGLQSLAHPLPGTYRAYSNWCPCAGIGVLGCCIWRRLCPWLRLGPRPFANPDAFLGRRFENSFPIAEVKKGRADRLLVAG